MPKISFGLDSESISKALKEIKAYQKKVENAGPELVKRLTEEGTQQAKEMAMYMNVYDSGELVNGIQSRFVGAFGVETAKGYVESTAPHSKFCEFGTGVVGKDSPHPNQNLIPGWKYDVNEHGEAGWWYWGDDGQWHWTKGMPSRPYMYDTATILKQSVPYVAEEVLK